MSNCAEEMCAMVVRWSAKGGRGLCLEVPDSDSVS